MRLTHRTERSRTAVVEQQKGGTLLFTYADAAGKERKKTFKPKGGGLAALAGEWLKLLRMATRDGFVATAPQDADGPVRWLVFNDGPYTGQQCFAVDRANDCVWLAEQGPGLLRRIARGSCDETVIELGKQSRVEGIGCTEGRCFALLSVVGKAAGAPAWSVPATGSYALNLVRIDSPRSIELLASVPFETPNELLVALGVSNQELLLGPHSEGAALYDANGKALETYAVAETQNNYPKGALSPDGSWLALTAPGNQVRVVARAGGTEHLYGTFQQVLRLAIADDGVAHVFGHGPSGWGIYAASTGKLTKVSSNVHGEPSPDGKLVLEITEGQATLTPSGGGKPTRSAKLPMLIGREGRAAFWDGDHAIVRMRGFTPSLELDLTKL